MKRKCKNIDITDSQFIESAINECLGNKSSKRRDVKKLMKEYGDIETLREAIQEELRSRKLSLRPIWYKERIEPSSQKSRLIAIQDIKQQIYDYIAVKGLEPVLKRIGDYQCSSIPKRGQIYCLSAVKKAVKKNNYFYKGDIKKYFQSVKPEMIMGFLRKRINNDTLLWLVEELITTSKDGLAIGSYLSQNLANLYMSILYHEVLENCYVLRKRRGKVVRKNCVNAAIFYMDDFVLFTNNKRYLNNIDAKVRRTLKSMGLELKENPLKADVRKTPVDIVGFRIWKDHVNIRKRNYIRCLRAFRRYARKPMSEKLARRVISFWGAFLHSDSFLTIKRNKLRPIIKRARRAIGEYDKMRCAAA